MKKIMLSLVLSCTTLSSGGHAGLIKNPLKSADTKAELALAKPAIAELKVILSGQLACITQALEKTPTGLTAGAVSEARRTADQQTMFMNNLDAVYGITDKAFRGDSQTAAINVLRGLIQMAYGSAKLAADRLPVLGIRCSVPAVSKSADKIDPQSIFAFRAQITENKTFYFVNSDLIKANLNPSTTLTGYSTLVGASKWTD